MDDLNKISKAIALVEKYESYLFRKAWGMALIVFGIAIPLTAFLNIIAPSVAPILGLPIEVFSLLTTVITWIISVSVIIYSFASATKLTSKKRKFSFHKEAPHIIAIMLVWFICFTFLWFAPEGIEIVSNLWAAGAACVLSYLILRRVPVHTNYPEILLVGIILLVASIPVLFIGDHY